METYNNGKLPNEVRKNVYLEFVQTYLQLIKVNNYKVDPIANFIQLVDPKGSLGGFIEEFLAKSLDVPISRVVINNMKVFSEKDRAKTLIMQEVEIPAARLSNNDNEPVLLVTQPLLNNNS